MLAGQARCLAHRSTKLGKLRAACRAEGGPVEPMLGGDSVLSHDLLANCGLGILSLVATFENLNSFPDAIFGANVLTT